MFYSRKYKLLFIASPKTGSKSVHNVLYQIDPEGKIREIKTDTVTVNPKNIPGKVLGHAKALNIKKALGDEEYNKLSKFAFVRNPYSKIVSSYFFNKQSELFPVSFFNKVKKGRYSQAYRYFFGISSAKILPFKLWFFIYPHKKNIEYVTDNEGNVIVDYIGRTEYLNKDLINILNKIGIDTTGIKLKKINTSKHGEFMKYFESKWFKKIVDKRFAEEIEFYKSISNKLN